MSFVFMDNEKHPNEVTILPDNVCHSFLIFSHLWKWETSANEVNRVEGSDLLRTLTRK
jgi:hypothetical protein